MSYNFDDIFGALPYGFCPFSLVKARLIPCRAMARLPENAQTVIVVLFPYYLGEDYYRDSNVSMYAVPADYHIIAGGLLQAAAEQLKARYPAYAFVPFCDNSPIPEVPTASCAGLGDKGVNGLLINHTYGSFCFIGEIVTDLSIPCQARMPSPCLQCGKCGNACPAGVLGGDGFNKGKCLSHISQQKKDLSAEEREMLTSAGCAWGCDICQKVCPMNRNIQPSPIRAFYETAKPRFIAGDSVEGRAFAWRGEKVINRNIGLLDASKGNKL
ncbi:MAG: epoxyqueuosine reductase [Clostridia bacterium]|nr:epoxyqueuosine reductase [Clostridia bacterium]